MRSARPFPLFAVLLACGDAGGGSGGASSTSRTTGTPTTDEPGTTPTVTGADTTAGDGTASAATSVEPTGATDITGVGVTTEDIGPKLDIGGMPDLGGGRDPGEIPATCAAASGSATTIGCSFYALDLDNYTPWDTSQWGLAVANVVARRAEAPPLPPASSSRSRAAAPGRSSPARRTCSRATSTCSSCPTATKKAAACSRAGPTASPPTSR